MIPIKFTVEKRPSLCCSTVVKAEFNLRSEVDVHTEDIRTPEQNDQIVKATKNILNAKLRDAFYGDIEKRLGELTIATQGLLDSEAMQALEALYQAVDQTRNKQADLDAMTLPPLI